MAVYSTGTLTTSTPSTALMTALDTEITSNGWTFIETYTNGTNVTNVYKSPAASNSAGIDFYVGVNRTSTTSTIGLIVGELYNSGTHLWRKYAPATNLTTPDASDYTYVDATGVLSNSATLFRGASSIVTVATATPFKWYSNITVNRMIIGTSAGGCTYAGLYDSLIPGETFPLCVLPISTGSTSSAQTSIGASTREPFQTSASASNWMCYLSTSATGFIYGNSRSGSATTYRANTYTGRPLVQKVAFYSGRATTASPRGILKDVVYLGGGTFPSETISFTRSSVTYNYIKAYTGTAIQTIWMPTQ